MKDYSKMSDFEINSAVHNLSLSLGYDLKFLGNDAIEWSKGGEVITTAKVEYTKNGLHNYCNNPSDAWTIIIENSITFNYDTAQVHVGSYFSDTAKVSENRNKALRAAMIVYLMMRDEE